MEQVHADCLADRPVACGALGFDAVECRCRGPYRRHPVARAGPSETATRGRGRRGWNDWIGGEVAGVPCRRGAADSDGDIRVSRRRPLDSRDRASVRESSRLFVAIRFPCGRIRAGCGAARRTSGSLFGDFPNRLRPSGRPRPQEKHPTMMPAPGDTLILALSYLDRARRVLDIEAAPGDAVFERIGECCKR